MRAEYINPFYQATQDVFKVMLSLPIERQGLRVVDELEPVHELNVVIGVTGDLKGSLLYSFPKAMALEMVHIMSGMKMEKLYAFVTSAMAEVANIISGNAATYFAKNGFSCNIAPPQIIVGESGTVAMTAEQGIVLPLKTDVGTLEITVSLHKA